MNTAFDLYSSENSQKFLSSMKSLVQTNLENFHILLINNLSFFIDKISTLLSNKITSNDGKDQVYQLMVTLGKSINKTTVITECFLGYLDNNDEKKVENSQTEKKLRKIRWRIFAYGKI